MTTNSDKIKNFCCVCKKMFKSETELAFHEFGKKHCDNLLRLSKNKPLKTKSSKPVESQPKPTPVSPTLTPEATKTCNETGQFAPYGDLTPGEHLEKCTPCISKKCNYDYDLYLQKIVDNPSKKVATSLLQSASMPGYFRRRKLQSCKICHVVFQNTPEFEDHLTSFQHIYMVKATGIRIIAHFARTRDGLKTTEVGIQKKTNINVVVNSKEDEDLRANDDLLTAGASSQEKTNVNVVVNDRNDDDNVDFHSAESSSFNYANANIIANRRRSIIDAVPENHQHTEIKTNDVLIVRHDIKKKTAEVCSYPFNYSGMNCEKTEYSPNRTKTYIPPLLKLGHSSINIGTVDQCNEIASRNAVGPTMKAICTDRPNKGFKSQKGDPIKEINDKAGDSSRQYGHDGDSRKRANQDEHSSRKKISLEDCRRQTYHQDRNLSRTSKRQNVDSINQGINQVRDSSRKTNREDVDLRNQENYQVKDYSKPNHPQVGGSKNPINNQCRHSKEQTGNDVNLNKQEGSLEGAAINLVEDSCKPTNEDDGYLNPQTNIKVADSNKQDGSSKERANNRIEDVSQKTNKYDGGSNAKTSVQDGNTKILNNNQDGELNKQKYKLEGDSNKTINIQDDDSNKLTNVQDEDSSKRYEDSNKKQAGCGNDNTTVIVTSNSNFLKTEENMDKKDMGKSCDSAKIVKTKKEITVIECKVNNVASKNAPQPVPKVFKFNCGACALKFPSSKSFYSHLLSNGHLSKFIMVSVNIDGKFEDVYIRNSNYDCTVCKAKTLSYNNHVNHINGKKHKNTLSNHCFACNTTLHNVRKRVHLKTKKHLLRSKELFESGQFILPEENTHYMIWAGHTDSTLQYWNFCQESAKDPTIYQTSVPALQNITKTPSILGQRNNISTQKEGTYPQNENFTKPKVSSTVETNNSSNICTQNNIKNKVADMSLSSNNTFSQIQVEKDIVSEFKQLASKYSLQDASPSSSSNQSHHHSKISQGKYNDFDKPLPFSSSNTSSTILLEKSNATDSKLQLKSNSSLQFTSSSSSNKSSQHLKISQGKFTDLEKPLPAEEIKIIDVCEVKKETPEVNNESNQYFQSSQGKSTDLKKPLPAKKIKIIDVCEVKKETSEVSNQSMKSTDLEKPAKKTKIIDVCEVKKETPEVNNQSNQHFQSSQEKSTDLKKPLPAKKIEIIDLCEIRKETLKLEETLDYEVKKETSEVSIQPIQHSQISQGKSTDLEKPLPAEEIKIIDVCEVKKETPEVNNESNQHFQSSQGKSTDLKKSLPAKNIEIIDLCEVRKESLEVSIQSIQHSKISQGTSTDLEKPLPAKKTNIIDTCKVKKETPEVISVDNFTKVDNAINKDNNKISESVLSNKENVRVAIVSPMNIYKATSVQGEKTMEASKNASVAAEQKRPYPEGWKEDTSPKFKKIKLIKRESTSVLCSICNVDFDDYAYFEEHLEKESHAVAIAQFRLDGCPLAEILSKVMADKKRSIPDSSGHFYCGVCSVKASNLQRFKKHLNGIAHELSEMEYEKKMKLEIKMAVLAGPDGLYNCTVCKMGWPMLQDYNRHLHRPLHKNKSLLTS